MKKRQILWAIVFGSMLAVTGCGDDETGGGNGTGATGGGGTGATGGGGTGATGGGGTSSAACEVLCGSCGVGTAECQSECESGFLDGNDGLDFEGCSSELNTLASCVDGNDCISFIFDCGTEYTAWISCVVGFEI
jgi:hypothetical protein